MKRGDSNYNAENGRPSVVWRGKITIGHAASLVRLSPIGHGEVLGKDGSVDPDLSGVAGAVDIISRIEVDPAD